MLCCKYDIVLSLILWKSIVLRKANSIVFLNGCDC